MGGLANPMSVFRGDRRAAGNNGQQAAMVAGLPSTQIGAVRNGASQNYSQQSQMAQADFARQQAAAQAQGLGGILQMLAYMHAMNPHATHQLSMQTPDGTKVNLAHKPPTFDQFGGGGGGEGAKGAGSPATAQKMFANYGNPQLDGSNMAQIMHTILLHRMLKGMSSVGAMRSNNAMGQTQMMDPSYNPADTQGY